MAELGTTSGEEAASTTDSDAAPRPALLAGRLARATLCAAGAATLCGLLALGGAGYRNWRPQHRGDSGSEVVSLGFLDAISDVLTNAADGIKSGEEGYADVQQLPGKLKSVGGNFVNNETGRPSMLPGNRLVATGPLIDMLKNGSYYAMLESKTDREKLKLMLKNPNDLHDGNWCEDDEEEHGGLCYMKCALLTDGVYPHRSTAFSCCKKLPCTLGNTHFTSALSVCAGYDVSGKKAGGACPHQRGGCFADEEVHLDMCYKKCVLLTNGTYSWRAAPATCCRYKGTSSCMEANASETSTMFSVGGGEFENLSALKLVPGVPHHPLTSETEVPE